MDRKHGPLLALSFVALSALASAHAARTAASAACVQELQPAARAVREADPEELAELLAGYAVASKSKEYAQVAAALERMTGFNNSELLKPAQEGLAYVPSKNDRVDAQEEAKALGMGDKGTIVKLCHVRVASVVDAAARVATAVGDKKSVDVLVKALDSKSVTENPPAVRAVIDALALHPEAGAKADVLVREILFSICSDDKSGEKFWVGLTDAPVPGYDLAGRYSAAIRYFGQRKSKDLKVIQYLAGLLRPPMPVDEHSPDNPPANYWEARHKAWLRYVRDVVWSLKQITGQTWKSGYEEDGGQASDAIAWIEKHRKDLGLK